MEILLNKTVFEVSGQDATTFLQGQLSNDINKIENGKIQINCYLQHQGKIIAILWLTKKDGGFYLIAQNELADVVINRLNMFKMMSEVEITKTNLSVIGVLDDSGEYILNDNLSINLVDNPDAKYNENNEIWDKACIENMLPEVYPQTSEKLTPQLLNLDENELGVDFNKGCYVGQEVVARMHYLGKPKRKMFKFSAGFPVAVSDELISEESSSAKASGVVVRVAKDDNNYLFLATCEVKLINSKITINNKIINTI